MKLKGLMSLFVILFIVLGVIIGTGVFKNSTAVAANAEVEPLVLETLETESSADFFVWMKEKADLNPAYEMETKLEKGNFVYETLVSTAERTQADLRSYLDDQGVDFRAFYIANKIFVRGGSLDLVMEIAGRSDVAEITANHEYQLQEPFMDPAGPQSPEAIEPNVTFIYADDVWALGIDGGGTVMAGNDTGLDETHPTIAPHYRGCLNPPTCSSWDHNYNWWDATNTYPTNPYDGHGHGTHTTGTMVGDDGGSNQIGVAPGAQTIHCKNMTNGGSGNDQTFTECFEWDLAPWDLTGGNADPAMAPDAINNSWRYWGGNNNVFRDEVQALHAAGILVEVSAGNEGPGCATLGSPSDYWEVLTTGSVSHFTTFPGTITGFSSRGPSDLDGDYFPDIMAPGQSIRSSLPGNSYGSWSGTSMAGPHATALVGLMWDACPALIGQVYPTIDIINITAVPLTGQGGSNCGGDYTDGPNNDWGNGTIHALAAVQEAIAQCDGDPDIMVDPASLWSTLIEGTTDVLDLNISNVGVGQLDWQLFEMGPPLLGGTYEPGPMPEGPAPEINVATSTQAGEPKAVPGAANPLAVLWDQYANWSGTDFAAQDFEPAYDQYDMYAGDDFENTEGWLVDTVVTRGGWGAYVDLNNASAIHWYIYADDGGEPAGVPGDGTEYWSLSLAPSDPQVSLGVVEPEDVVLTLDAPVVLPPGNWWLVHFVSLEFGVYGQYGWSGTSDPVWGEIGKQNNPGGGFGNPPGWNENTYGEDYMFRLEGEPFADVPWLSEDPISGTLSAGQMQIVDVTFDAGGMTPGDYYASLLVLSNDPDDPMVSVPVTMTVEAIVFGVELDPPADAMLGDPGTVVTYTLDVNNTGNYTDTIDVGYSGNVWDVNLPETLFELGAGEGTTFYVGVAVPVDAMGGDSDMVTVTATAGDGTTTDTSDLTTTANALYGVAFMPDSYSYPGDPGFYAQYMVAMTNTGNVEDTFDITYGGNDPDWMIEIPDAQFTLASGEATGVAVRVWVPANALAGEMDTVTITSTSQGDSAVFESVDLTTVAAEVYDAVMAPDTDAMFGDPGETVEYMLTFTNTSNITATFDVTYTDFAPGWVVDTPQTHFPNLAVGESADVTIWVTVPADAGDGDFDTVTITLISADISETMDTSILTTTASVEGYDVFLPFILKAGSAD
jgi:uncharacterized repeat protein (TIGR01451 family)